MKNLENIIAFTLVMAIITAVVYVTYKGIGYFTVQLDWLNKEQLSLLSLGIIIIILCTLILASAIRYSRPKGDRHIVPEKAIVYNNFINYYISIRSSIQYEGEVNYRFRSDMVLWAGSNVLKKYMVFNQYLNDLNSDNPKILEQAEKVIMEMRNELGQYTYGLKPGDLDKLIFAGKTYKINDMGIHSQQEYINHS